MKYGSRLNSMKDRSDLWEGPNDVFGWVARQGTIKGLDLVDFNYPQVSG
jgi:xylose isomerase